MNIYFGHCLPLIGTVNNTFYYRCFQICKKIKISKRRMCFVSLIPLRRNIHYLFITDQKACTWSLTWYSKLKEDIRLMVVTYDPKFKQFSSNLFFICEWESGPGQRWSHFGYFAFHVILLHSEILQPRGSIQKLFKTNWKERKQILIKRGCS